MNLLYAIESNYSLTGATADHRLRVKPSDVANFVFDLARELGAITGLKVLGQQDKFIKALAKDLNANKGKSIVLAWPRQPAVVHAVVALINHTLANAGETVSYSKEEQVARLVDPLLLLDDHAVHERDLARWPAEAEAADLQPDAHCFGEGHRGRHAHFACTGRPAFFHSSMPPMRKRAATPASHKRAAVDCPTSCP